MNSSQKSINSFLMLNNFGISAFHFPLVLPVLYWTLKVPWETRGLLASPKFFQYNARNGEQKHLSQPSITPF